MLKAIGCQQAHFEIFQRCITPMTSVHVIDNKWPEIAELLAICTRLQFMKFTQLEWTV